MNIDSGSILTDPANDTNKLLSDLFTFFVKLFSFISTGFEAIFGGAAV